MQTLVQVVCNRKQTSSLRQKINKDKKLKDFNLECIEEKRNDRPEGWSKLKSMNGANGAINIQWDDDTKTLSARVITKNGNNPFELMSQFVAYVYANYKNSIRAINIYPVE